MKQVPPEKERVSVEIWAQTSGVERLDLCSVCDTPIIAGRVVLPRFRPGRGVEYDDPHNPEITIKVVWVSATKGDRVKLKIPLRTAAFRPGADGLSEAQHLIANTLAEILVKEMRENEPDGVPLELHCCNQ